MAENNDNGWPRMTNEPTPAERDLVANLVFSRLEFMKTHMDPRKEVDRECGYPDTSTLSVEKYRDLYERDPIAARVVEVMPKESWQSPPSVYEEEDSDTKTAFEEAWDDLGNSLRGDSYYADDEEKGSPIWEYLQRADILSGIGSYGVILLGLDDGDELKEPVKGFKEDKEGTTKEHKLLFIRCFDESLAKIARYETERTSPRFGQPIAYNITFADYRDRAEGVGVETVTQEVHWHRVIHVADNLGSSEIFGAPRMRVPLNRLLDLQKVYGSAGEGYWRGAFPGLSLESLPQLGGDVEIDEPAVRKHLQNYMNSLQRFFVLKGMTAKSLAPQVVDPTPQIKVYIEAICILIAVPVRIFVGSERGELASDQDDSSWNDRVRGRQKNYLTPRVIIPFVDRLIKLGVLPIPDEGYRCQWPDLDTMTAQEQATLAVSTVDAMSKYTAGGIDVLCPPLDFYTNVLGWEQAKAEAVLENAVSHIEEANPDAEQDVVPGRNPPPPVPEVPLGPDGKPLVEEAAKAGEKPLNGKAANGKPPAKFPPAKKAKKVTA